jgi:hypothetical protein
MAKFKIDSITTKNLASGKLLKKANLTGENGGLYEQVAIWDSFPMFASLAEGQTVEGDLKTVVNGQYTNHTLYPMPTGKPAYGAKSNNISKAMERKEASIETFQGNKELSIKVSATLRDAVLLAISEYENSDDNQYQLDELVTKWRHWLWLQWDKTTTDEIAPF